MAAHIHAAAPGGARYNANQSSEVRSSISNGIWLCQTCSRLVDVDECRFPHELLREWKKECEDETLAQLDGMLGLALTPATQKAIAGELLNQAFDLFAGDSDSIRIVWPVLETRMLEKARRAIVYASALDPENDRLPLLQGMYHISVGFPDRALEIVDAASARHSGLRALRVRCLFDLGRLEEAAQQVREEIATGEATAASYYNLGVLVATADSSEALQHLHKAIELDPNYAQAHRTLARIYFSMGKEAEGTAHLDLAFRCQPGDASIASMMARRLLDSGRLLEADSLAEKALDSNPMDAELWALLGEARGRRREYEDAGRCIKRALVIDPFNAVALNNQLVLLMESQNSRALKDFLKSFPVDEPSIPEDLRAMVLQVRTLCEQSGADGPSPFVTEEGLFDRLQAHTSSAGPFVAVERFAISELASPGEADGFQGTGVLFVAATTRFLDELPLAQVRLNSGGQAIPLRLLKQRIRRVPEDRAEIAVRLGENLYEGLFACPLRTGAIEIDFAKRRTQMPLMTLSESKDAESQPSDEALHAIASREFPVMFDSEDEPKPDAP